MELDHNSSTHDVDELVSLLSPMLQREVIIHINRHFVSEVPFLADADRIFVWCLLERMEVIVCVAKEYILMEGESIEAMHIIKTGKVDVIGTDGIIIRTYTEGSFFGEQCVGEEKLYAQKSYRAKHDMELALVPQDELKILLEAFPEFNETLTIILHAREKHERRETEVYEEKMKKMVKQTGMKARPVTPPPGKTWGGAAAVRGRGESTRSTSSPGSVSRSDSPTSQLTRNESRIALINNLGDDIKRFDASEKRLSEINSSKSTLHADDEHTAKLKAAKENAIKKGISTIDAAKEASGGGDDEKESDESSGESDSEGDSDGLGALSTRGARFKRPTAENTAFLAQEASKVSAAGRAKQRQETLLQKGASGRGRQMTMAGGGGVTPTRDGRRLSIGGGNGVLPGNLGSVSASSAHHHGAQRKSILAVNNLSAFTATTPPADSRGMDQSTQKELFQSLEKLLASTSQLNQKFESMDKRLAKLEKGGITFAGDSSVGR
jgi:CRP-like cAMP-binding protein